MDRLFATKSEGVGLIVRAISFQDFFLIFLTYVITIHQRRRQTDRRKDGRTDGQVDDMRSQDRALQSELCGNKDLHYSGTCSIR